MNIEACYFPFIRISSFLAYINIIDQKEHKNTEKKIIMTIENATGSVCTINGIAKPAETMNNYKGNKYKTIRQ